MADKRIPDFDTLPEPLDNDLMLISSDDETYNIEFGAIKRAIVSRHVIGIDYAFRTSAGVLFGDANGDGGVDNADLSTVAKYVEGKDVYINVAAVDFDGDGIVSLADQLKLAWFLVHMDDNQRIIKTTYTYDDGSTEFFWGVADKA